MNYKSVREELIKRNGNRCSICGHTFYKDEIPEIDHIIPRRLGGEDNIENLQLTCSICNKRKADKLIYTEFFEKHITSIIRMSGEYEIIYPKGQQDRRIDLILREKENGKYKICEIKANTAFTEERITNIINELMDYQEKVKKKYMNVTSVFIFLGKLSPGYEKLFKKHNIEVWDREYIVSKFEKEIIKLNNLYFSSILKIGESKPRAIDKYEEKRTELKKCKAGRENWYQYQKLVGEILELLFCPPLNKPLGEIYDRHKVNRRDFIMPNYAPEGFWKFMRENYCADFIVIDAKNSAKGISKQDILQVSNYLKKHRYRIIWNGYRKKI